MGKVLFISGVDYSNNKVDGYVITPSFLAYLNLTIGKTWTGHGTNPPSPSDTVNNKYASSPDFTDVAEFSMDSVTITAKDGYKFAIYAGDGIGDSVVSWGWQTSLTLNNSDSLKKVVIMVTSTGGSEVLTSANIFDYLTEIVE